ncbi:MAG TPA: hypothetical protein PK536_12750, partial [Ignavibacteria bacterium]|nr:hypothetical protein [Ignavibacteria bacterium]HRJ99586.1 hypothetical protein [Ignavibacteria bacterium]
MKDFREKFSVNGKTVELINRYSDPAMWIVNVLKKFFIFKSVESSHWFNSRKDAEDFINDLKLIKSS